MLFWYRVFIGLAIFNAFAAACILYRSFSTGITPLGVLLFTLCLAATGKNIFNASKE